MHATGAPFAAHWGPERPTPPPPAIVARVGVHPARERTARSRLLGALEQAYSVRFEPREGGDWDGLDGVVLIGGDVPELPPGLPALRALAGERALGSPRGLILSDRAELERPLRGARLSERWAGALDAAHVRDEDISLARIAGLPAWTASAGPVTRALVSAAPAELAEGEALRERLMPGRSLAALALIHFLSALLPGAPAPARQLRAAFVIDDPNLHWPTYGHVNYDELSRHARTHGYHVAVAMVPLDGWLAHSRAVTVFDRRAEQLSICVHGNDHRGPELGTVSSEAEGVELASQALARAQAFERRTGLTVDRVMVPPHERLSLAAARGLLATGFEAICASRPYPWIAEADSSYPLSAPAERGALAGWESREIVAGGLPLLLRAGFNAPREDLVLRAFLGQPLILYGHHDLLEHGLDVLSDAAAAIETLGEVRWSSLADIARAGVQTRHSQQTLEVALLARRARLSVPDDVRRVRLNAVALAGSSETRLRVVRNGRRPGTVSPAADPVVLEVGGGEMIETDVIEELAPADRRSTRPRIGPLLWRMASAGRDRTRAIRAPGVLRRPVGSRGQREI